MSYLYGDSSPFPLEGDFLETLLELTETAVGILRVHHRTADAQAQMRRIAAEADRDAKWLAEMSRGVAQRVRAEADRAPTEAVRREATRLLEVCHQTVAQGRDRVFAKRNAALAELEAATGGRRRTVHAILERFLLARELPNSVWGVSWRVRLGAARTRVVSEALVLSPCGLEATFKLDVEEGSRWSRPVRVDELVAELSVQVPRRSGLRGRTTFKKRSLSRLQIVAADWSPDRCALTLQHKAREGSGGYEFTRTAEALTIQPLEAIGDPTQTAHPDGEEAAAVRGLLDAVERDLRPLSRHRVLATEIAIDEKPLDQVQDLAGIAQRLIQAIAPYVRELVRRSPVSQELSLKRDLGDRRREEVYVPTRELINLIRSLPPDLRDQFAPFGPPFHHSTVRQQAGQIEEALLALAN